MQESKDAPQFPAHDDRTFTDSIEELTGRKVLAFLSQSHVDPDLSLEILFVDGPLEGFGAVELVEPEQTD